MRLIAAVAILAGLVSVSPVSTFAATHAVKPDGFDGPIIYEFRGPPDGQHPVSSLTIGANNTLFGTTMSGGLASCPSDQFVGCGTVFSLNRSGSTYKENLIYTFPGGPAGADPFGSMVQDGAGDLYGVTFSGGSDSSNCFISGFYGCGTVFRLTKTNTGFLFTSILQFDGTNGLFPDGSPMLLLDGSLVLETQSGGKQHWGNVVEIQPRGNKYVVRELYEFKDFADGIFPAGGLTQGPDGVLYGTTSQGGYARAPCYSQCGTVFSLTPAGKLRYKKQIIYQFKGGADGAQPDGLVVDSTGTLYGSTHTGGVQTGVCFRSSGRLSGCGTVYSLTPSSSGYQERVIYAFSGPDGKEPDSQLVIRRDSLYGETFNGGNGTSCSLGCGTVFRIKRTGSTFTEQVLLNFEGGNHGEYPTTRLTLVNDALYGTTQGGGSSCSCGTAFALPLR